MELLRGPLYLDIAAKGLGLLGVALMIFGRGAWFIAGAVAAVEDDFACDGATGGVAGDGCAGAFASFVGASAGT